jgi:hypothetical protein
MGFQLPQDNEPVDFCFKKMLSKSSEYSGFWHISMTVKVALTLCIERHKLANISKFTNYFMNFSQLE